MTENIISMKKIDKFYDDFHVLKGIDFRKSILKDIFQQKQAW